MEQNQTTQRLLNWFDKEKTKDKLQIDVNKKKVIQEIRKLKKNDLIKVPEKLPLWKRIRIMILGY